KARNKEEPDEHDEGQSFRPSNAVLATPEGKKSLRTRMHTANVQGNVISWRALWGKLGQLNRLKVFHNESFGPKPLNYRQLFQPGHVSVIDLSDSGASQLNNLVIADLLRGVQDAQDAAYAAYETGTEQAPPRVLIVIEEAHEFLSAERIDKMRILFE